MDDVNEKLEIHIHEIENRPTIVFVHGTSMGAWCWDEYFTPYFRRHGYGVCSFSMRGHGASYGRDRMNSFGVNDFVDDCEKVIDMVRNEPIIVAHSAGAVFVLKLLNKRPDIASKVVFLCPAANKGMLKDYAKVFIGHFRAGSMERIYFSDRISDEKIALYRRKMCNISWKTSAELLKPFKLNDEIKTKQYMIVGSSSDLCVVSSDMIGLSEELSAKMVIFPEMCHMVMVDPDWEKTAEAVLEFIGI